MEFKHVAILLTENCNAHCKMCCDRRGLVQGKTLSEKEIEKILIDIKNCREITTVGITGGEPLLYPELIEKILFYDYDRNIKFSVKTNGFWGRNKNYAYKIIKKFKNKLSHISLSYDEFHMCYINIECLKNIILIAKEFNISTDVVGCFLKNSVTPGDILNQFGECAYYTKFCYQPVIATGAAEIFDKKSYIKLLETDMDTLKCIASIEPDILINPQLDIYPCCSQVIENTILKVGNLKDKSLNETLSDIKHNYIFNTIFTEGFSPYIKILKELQIEYPQYLASPCEFCEFLFKNDWFLKILNERNYYENFGK